MNIKGIFIGNEVKISFKKIFVFESKKQENYFESELKKGHQYLIIFNFFVVLIDFN